MKVIGCIPSRYASTRLPGKPLCDIGGKPMVIHVVEHALRAKSLDEVIVLTDDERILKTVEDAGYRAAMTAENCACGTDRIADFLQQEARDGRSGDVFVNIQGDEVLLDPQHVDQLVQSFLDTPNAQMGTLAQWVSDPKILQNPATAKVVIGQNNQALYFSRNCIPVTQNGSLPERALVQIGVYIYSRTALQRLTTLQQTPLESIEKLEQLRALEHGINIGITIVDHYHSLSVDTPEDLETARALFTELK